MPDKHGAAGGSLDVQACFHRLVHVNQNGAGAEAVEPCGRDVCCCDWWMQLLMGAKAAQEQGDGREASARPALCHGLRGYTSVLDWRVDMPTSFQ